MEKDIYTAQLLALQLMAYEKPEQKNASKYIYPLILFHFPLHPFPHENKKNDSH